MPIMRPGRLQTCREPRSSERYSGVRQSHTPGVLGLPRIVGLDWDDDDDADGNVQHIAKHGVSPEEVREVLESGPVFWPAEPGGPNPFYVAVGVTAQGRLLEVWGIHCQSPPLNNFWHTVTAMEARPANAARYAEERGARRRSGKKR